MLDKRSGEIRVNKLIPVVLGESEEGERLRAHITNISRGGMQILSTHFMEPGTKSAFVIRIVPRLSITGEVRWIKVVGNSFYTIGVSFTDVSPRLTKQLSNILQIAVLRPGLIWTRGKLVS